MFSNKGKAPKTEGFNSTRTTVSTSQSVVRNTHEIKTESFSYQTSTPLFSSSYPKLSNLNTFEEKKRLNFNFPSVTTSSLLTPSTASQNKYSLSTSSVPRLTNTTTTNVLKPANTIWDSRPRSTITSTDAVAFNPNYVSPYRGASQYRSFQSHKPPATSLAINKPEPKAKSQPFNKNLVVKKTIGKLKEPSPLTYQTTSKNRGEALIINNIMFEENKERLGAKEDDKQMEKLLSKIGFNVKVHRNLKSSQMISKIKDFSKKSSLRSVDIAIVVIMSHGTKNNSISDTEIVGVDEHRIAVEEILENFTDSNCKYMKDKPKIFIFQCCRGNNEQFLQNDATPILQKSPVRDVLIAYSTIPGFVSYREPDTGTWYIQTLCTVFSQHAHEYHVEDLLRMVDVELGSIDNTTRQTSSYENRGFKKCYLNPR